MSATLDPPKSIFDLSSALEKQIAQLLMEISDFVANINCSEDIHSAAKHMQLFESKLVIYQKSLASFSRKIDAEVQLRYESSAFYQQWRYSCQYFV